MQGMLLPTGNDDPDLMSSHTTPRHTPQMQEGRTPMSTTPTHGLTSLLAKARIYRGRERGRREEGARGRSNPPNVSIQYGPRLLRPHPLSGSLLPQVDSHRHWHYGCHSRHQHTFTTFLSGPPHTTLRYFHERGPRRPPCHYRRYVGRKHQVQHRSKNAVKALHDGPLPASFRIRKHPLMTLQRLKDRRRPPGFTPLGDRECGP